MLKLKTNKILHKVEVVYSFCLKGDIKLTEIYLCKDRDKWYYGASILGYDVLPSINTFFLTKEEAIRMAILTVKDYFIKCLDEDSERLSRHQSQFEFWAMTRNNYKLFELLSLFVQLAHPAAWLGGRQTCVRIY